MQSLLTRNSPDSLKSLLFLPSYPTTNLRMSLIEYLTTDFREIDLIRPLWIQLNKNMQPKAKTFRSHFEQMTFNDRKVYFETVSLDSSLRLDLASDPHADDRYVGHCVSSLSKEMSGEIESIFVEEMYRSRGTGRFW